MRETPSFLDFELSIGFVTSILPYIFFTWWVNNDIEYFREYFYSTVFFSIRYTIDYEILSDRFNNRKIKHLEYLTEKPVRLLNALIIPVRSMDNI